MPSEFASRYELDGLGIKVTAIQEKVAGHHEAIENSKQDRRDLWSATTDTRKEIALISKDVAKQNVIFLIVNAIIVALIVKYLGGQ